MKKKPRRAKKPTSASAQVGGLDVVKLYDFLEGHYTDIGDTKDSSWYRGLYWRSRQAFLKGSGDPSTVPFATMLDSVDAYTPVEDATREAGFVLGFECCRQLLLGELNLEALKDGGVE